MEPEGFPAHRSRPGDSRLQLNYIAKKVAVDQFWTSAAADREVICDIRRLTKVFAPRKNYLY